ncbi:MAG: ankyrin repeat domain-containing protein [Armatimonas sp.]
MARPDPRLPEAARRGETATVRALIRQRADLNSTLGDGTTALHWAVQHDDPALVESLLRAGANPEPRSRIGGLTPLILAASSAQPPVVQALLWYGADPNTATENGLTPLMSAAGGGNTRAVSILLQVGADLRSTEDIYGQNALHFAAAKNRANAIRALLNTGADPNRPSRVTSLNQSRFDEDGNPIRGGGVGDRPARSTSPAIVAASARRASAIVLGGNTPLTLAARHGHLEATEALLKGGASINAVSAGDKTSPLITAICNGHFDLARYLIEKKADPNLANVDGLTPLYATIDTQWAPVGWAPNPITDREQTDHVALLRLLLDKGANPNTRLTRKLWFRPTHHDECWIGTAGATPFWRAAQGNDLAAMKLLISRGANPKITTLDNDNALMVAAGLGWNGNFSVQGADSAFDVVSYCLELGLDPNDVDLQGYTALCGAAYRGDNALVRLLFSHGARLDTRSSRGWSVTDMANGPSLRSSVPVKHPETVALLRSLGAPPLTNIDNEEILGIIRQRPNRTESTK